MTSSRVSSKILQPWLMEEKSSSTFHAKSSQDDWRRVRIAQTFGRIVCAACSRTPLEAHTKRIYLCVVVKSQERETKKILRAEMDSNATLFLAAGSETTATTLSGSTYLLLSNPDKYAKVVREVRKRFKSANGITVEEVNKLEYMIACFSEGLRHYPPVPDGFPRLVPVNGNRISGHYIPGGTAVSVSQYAANHSEHNFKDPEAYVPERWLGDEKYRDDKREAFNPFSFGPRNCLGRK
jgi:cytochrome P450